MKQNTPLELVQQAVELAKKAGADEADAIMFEDVELSARCRLGELETVERSESRGIGVRVLIKDKLGYRQAISSSSAVSEKTIAALIEKVVAIAKVAPPDPFIAIAGQELLARDIPNLDLLDSSPAPTAETLQTWAQAAEEAALAVKGVTNSDGADAAYSYGDVALAISSGFAKSYASTSFSVSTSVIAGEGQDMQTDYDYTVSRHAEDLLSPADIGRRAGERAMKRMFPVKKPSCKAPVIFDNRVSRSLLSAFSGAINGAGVTRGTSFLKHHLGKQVFANGITIIDDPLLPRGLSSEAFDAEGVAGKRLELIQDGILTTWLLDIRSANQLNMRSTGHASRGLSSAPSPSSSNMYMVPGTSSVEDMIADIKDGFFITELFGMGVNGVTGDYSQGASGFWIENGKLAYPVAEMTIASNLKDMFLNLTPANDLEFLSSKNAPSLLIQGMTIAGT